MAQTQGDYGSSMTVNKKAPARPKPGINSRTGKSYGAIGFSASPASSVPNLPVRRPTPGPVNNGGAGYGGGSGGVGSNALGHISSFSAPPPPPAPPTLDQFSAKDSTYQNQLSALKKALADYMAQQGQAKTQYLTGYTGDLDTLKQNRTQGLGDLENDYASRGLLQSGLYADSMSDLNNDFDKRQAALDQARAAFLANQGSDLTNFKSEQQITQQRALQEAAARRAAQYGI